MNVNFCHGFDHPGARWGHRRVINSIGDFIISSYVP